MVLVEDYIDTKSKKKEKERYSDILPLIFMAFSCFPGVATTNDDT